MLCSLIEQNRKRESINSSSSTTRSIINKGDVTSVNCILVFVVVIGSLPFRE